MILIFPKATKRSFAAHFIGDPAPSEVKVSVASCPDPCYNEQMAMQTLEGTWEDIAQHAPELVGRRVRLTILEEEMPQPNEAMLTALRKIAERSKNMPSR